MKVPATETTIGKRGRCGREEITKTRKYEKEEDLDLTFGIDFGFSGLRGFVILRISSGWS
jgi:hypothetical protein